MQINKIYHLADIHLRLFRRHKEYQQVFNRLFEHIKSTKDEQSVIVLAGDIVHNKIDMSPELVDITSKFLKGCADLLPTILIMGNHDRLTNLSRLDALTPIVNTLNHPNLHYWKDSGVYKLGGIAWSVFGIADEPDKWTLAKDMDAKHKIALYHGMVQGSLNDSGFDISTNGISIKYFEGFDIGLLGDIHMTQFLNEEKTVAHVGSLLQQDHGESIDGHGLLVWDLKSKRADHIPIPNDYGYYTFHLINGKCDIPKNLPKNLRVRIKYENTTPDELTSFVKNLGKTYRIIELIQQKNNSLNSTTGVRSDLLGNSRDISYQNSVICEYLTTMLDICSEELQEVCALNLEMNKRLPVSSVKRNVIWKPIRLEFSNMFSYGEDNVMDFTNLNGSYGIFAKNFSGKSAFLDVLTFAVSDKTTRATKASHIMNNNKNKFYCKLQFELGGVEYFIERIGTRKTDGNVKVDVNFWYFDETGEKVSLNGEDRDKTNYAIRNFLGTYDDFVMTALSTQYDNQNFVEKTQKDRKELLYKFLDIFIYDDLFKLAKEQSKEFQVLIRELEKEGLQEKSSTLYSTIETLEGSIQILDDDINRIKGSIKNKTNELLELNKSHIPVKAELDINKIEDELDTYKNQLKSTLTELNDIKVQSKELQDQLSNVELESEPFIGNVIDLSICLDRYSNYNNQLSQLQAKIDKLKDDIKKCYDQKEHLDRHEYDPNCEFCTNNAFVKNAIVDIKRIPELEKMLSDLDRELLEVEFSVGVWQGNLNQAKTLDVLMKKGSDIKQKLNLLSEKESTLKYKGKTIQGQLKDSEKRRLECLENSVIIEKNAEILKSIDHVKASIVKLENDDQILQTNHRKFFTELERTKSEYETSMQKMDKYLDLIKKYRVYDLYCQALSRDGVPYRILENVLPVIEAEVNTILNQLTTFTVRLEANDEKYIHAFIVYNGSDSWPIELSSGMERFILSLAFRTSLCEITSLPKANFLAIDEGFGVLDAENVQSMGGLFTYLKQQYDYLLIISHIDSMRDLVDNQIKIDKVDGYSKIYV